MVRADTVEAVDGALRSNNDDKKNGRENEERSVKGEKKGSWRRWSSDRAIEIGCVGP